MNRLDKCCCFDLRTGCLVLGYLALVKYLLLSALVVYALAVVELREGWVLPTLITGELLLTSSKISQLIKLEQNLSHFSR